MPTPEEYLEKGYVFHGYFPEELSSSDEYPDYIKEEVEDSVKKILSHQNTDTITFAFMADTHYAPTYNHHIRLTRTLNAYKEIAKRVTIDKLILGGDLGANGCKEFSTKAMLEFRSHFDGIEYYPVLGNHDDNSIWQACIASETSEHHFSHDELYSMMFNHLPKQGVEFDEMNRAPYYLYNDKYSKTRYIFTDSTDVPYFIDNGNLRYRGQHTYVFSQAQIDWIINKALKFDEAGWSVVVVGHTFELPERPTTDGESYLEAFREILNAYKEKKSLKKSFYDGDFRLEVDADFTDNMSSDVTAVILGHHHDDFEVADDNGIVYISTGNATMYNNAKHQRHDDSKDEILFDVMTVDKRTRTIHITRVGYGEDRIVKY